MQFIGIFEVSFGEQYCTFACLSAHTVDSDSWRQPKELSCKPEIDKYQYWISRTERIMFLYKLKADEEN